MKREVMNSTSMGVNQVKAKRVSWKPLAALVILLCAASCNPTEFLMGSDTRMKCRILTPLNTVTPGSNMFTVRNGGVVSIERTSVTQYNASMYLKVHGDGVRLYLRSISDYAIQDSGVRLTLTSRGSFLDTAGKSVRDIYYVKFPQDSLIPMSVYSENNYLRVTMACDTIVQAHVQKKETNQIIVEALPGSEVTLAAPRWKELPQ